MAREKSQKVLTKKHLARIERERIQTRNLMIASFTVIALVVILIGYALLNQYVLVGYKTVANVNGDKITVREFQDQVRFDRWQLIRQYQQNLQMYQVFGADSSFSQSIKSSLQQIESQLSPDGAVTLGSTALDELIGNKIIEQEAAKRGITVTQEELDQAMQEAFGFYANGTPTPAITPTPASTSTLSAAQEALIATQVPSETPTPVETLAPTTAPTETPAENEPTGAPEATATPYPTATPYTLEGYQNELKKVVDEVKGFGYSESKLREVIRISLLHKKLYDEITADVQPIQEQVWARHILVQDEAIANLLYDRLQAGAAWNEVAAQLPENDPENPSGVNTAEDLGWFGRGQMDPAFEEAAFKLSVGEISKPVKSGFGWHIIQVIGHEDRPLTSQQLQQERQQVFSEWFTQAKSAESIQQFDVWMDEIPDKPEITSAVLPEAQ